FVFITLISLNSCQEEEPVDSETKEKVIITPLELSAPALKEFSTKSLTVDIFSSISLYLNYAPSKTLQVENGYLKYELKYWLQNGDKDIALNTSHISDSLVIIDSKELLSLGTSYTFRVQATWFYSVDTLIGWQPCSDEYIEEISQVIQSKSDIPGISLDSSDFITHYPLIRQYNFLPKEYDKGYLILQPRKHRHFLAVMDKVTITSLNENKSISSELSQNADLKIFEYSIPGNFLQNNAIYEVSVYANHSNNPVYSYHFKTSKYNSFTEKWEVIKNSFGGKWRDYISSDDLPYSTNSRHVQAINNTIYEENLDYYEGNSNRFNTSSMPLIQYETQVPYSWLNTVEWQIYQQPSLTFNRQITDCKKYGFPPVRAIYHIVNEKWSVKLNDKEIETNSIQPPELPVLCIFVWEVQNFMRMDVASSISTSESIPIDDRTEWQNLAVDGYHNMPRLWLDFALGDDVYPKLDALYVLPGINVVTTRITDIQL
ncbi:MAG: hypothetical protein MI922_06785, partial [Bacteroidales bacterium]|nr:hypothetical protein [Bacteroidales bacterium]